MPSNTFTPAQWSSWMKDYPRKAKKAGNRALIRAAHRGKAAAVAAWRQRAFLTPAPVDTGQLLRSYIVGNPQPGLVFLENLAPHAAAQEFGTRPFTPPIAPLEAWAARKLRRAKRAAAAAKKSKRKPKKTAASRPAAKKVGPRKPRGPSREAKRLARAVQWAISKRGIKPKARHGLASRQFPRFIREEMTKALGAMR